MKKLWPFQFDIILQTRARNRDQEKWPNFEITIRGKAETLLFSPIAIQEYTKNPDRNPRQGRNIAILSDCDPKLNWNS